MKKVFLAILLTSSSLTADAEKTSARVEKILTDASYKRLDAISKADREYRAALATTFQLADRVEVYLLDFSIGKDAAYIPKDDDAVFPIRPYDDKETKIIKTLKVTPKDIPKWCTALGKLLASDKEGGQALCHFPIHGIRIYAGDKLLFETSICWVCSNYYFSYESHASWESLNEDAKDLEMLLTQFMPIPEAEKARFLGSKQKVK
jgi:hypothetical protein